jgi:hypothetical protein
MLSPTAKSIGIAAWMAAARALMPSAVCAGHRGDAPRQPSP